MKRVKNILFDLGGVIIDIDVNKTTQEMAFILGIEDLSNGDSVLNHKIFKQYETGNLNSTEFVQALRAIARTDVEESHIIKAWNAMLIHIPESRVKLLEELSNKNRLLVLSNTNELHINQFNTMIPGYSNLTELFEKVYYSNEIGCRKPTKESFNIVIKESSIDPTETLFIDDTLENIKAASEMNFQTLLIEKDEDITQLLVEKYPSLV